jgi:hypothetical protein
MSSALKVPKFIHRLSRSSSEGSGASQDRSINHDASADPENNGTIDYWIDINTGQSKTLNHFAIIYQD